jgi:two-component system response regulator RegA
MEKKGFFVETFASYETCLKRCFEENFDYAVVDMRLEDGSGLELIKKLKEIDL